MKGTRSVVVLGLVALTAMSFVACGDDDDEETGTGSAAGGEAVALPPNRVFRNLTTALEAQGLVVAKLPEASLNGAEAGIEISGEKSGTALSFPTESAAQDYAGEVEMAGDKTVIVGTVVFQAPTQSDAEFFADAYED